MTDRRSDLRRLMAPPWDGTCPCRLPLFLMIVSCGCGNTGVNRPLSAGASAESACAAFVGRLSTLPCWVGALPHGDVCAEMTAAIPEGCESDFAGVLRCYAERAACAEDGSRNDLAAACAEFATDCTAPRITVGLVDREPTGGSLLGTAFEPGDNGLLTSEIE